MELLNKRLVQYLQITCISHTPFPMLMLYINIPYKNKKKADASYHMCSMTSYIYKNKLFYNVTFVILPTLPCVMTLLIV